MKKLNRFERIAWFGVVAPAFGSWAFMFVLMLIPRTPVIVFQVAWSLTALTVVVSFIVVMIKGDKRSRIIALVGAVVQAAFVGLVTLAVFAIRAAWG